MHVSLKKEQDNIEQLATPTGNVNFFFLHNQLLATRQWSIRKMQTKMDDVNLTTASTSTHETKYELLRNQVRVIVVAWRNTNTYETTY